MAMPSAVGKSYDQIWKAFLAEFGPNATLKTHNNWKRLAAEENIGKAGKSRGKRKK